MVKYSFLIFLTACVLPYSQLIMLRQLVDNQKLIEKEIILQKKKFNHLYKEIREGRLVKGKSKKEIIRRYGKPILEEVISFSPYREEFLYRDPLTYFSFPRIYLYFDQEKRLIDFKIINES